MYALPRPVGTSAFPELLAGCVGVAAPIVLQPGAAAQLSPTPAYGATRIAGVYHCTPVVAGPIGGSCSCLGVSAPSYRVIH